MANLKLNEWNASCEYAKETCKKLKDKGYDVRVKPYSVYDGRMGIYLQVFDNMNNFFAEFATGIHTSLNEMKKSIDIMALKIIKEC